MHLGTKIALTVAFLCFLLGHGAQAANNAYPWNDKFLDRAERLFSLVFTLSILGLIWSL